MKKGDFFYTSDISVQSTRNQYLVLGFGNTGIDTFQYKKHNNKLGSLYCYGTQAAGTSTKLGIAIMFPSSDYVMSRNAQPADSIPNSCYAVIKPSTDKKKEIFFFACWEKTDARFSEKAGFENYLQETADRLANPLKIKIVQ
jgi:hypothetical protein